MGKAWLISFVLVAKLAVPAASAHELWFQARPAADSAVIRLTFGDSPELSEAERVAEIAHATAWADGQPCPLKRLPDGLDAHLPRPDAAVVSAFADRGVVTHMGQSFIIYLAAYAQSRAIEPSQATRLGLGDDQARLLLIAKTDGPPVVRLTWKGKPVAAEAIKVFHGHGEPTELRTDSSGEIPCPDLREGPWSMLAQVVDKTPGKRDGRDYLEIRFKATLTIGAEAAFGPAVAACLTRVKEIHGAAGPWVVAGYRIGERALKELGLPRHSHDVEIVHRCPSEVQYSCMADGLMAATGASPGKLNLHLETVNPEQLQTTVRNKRTNRSLVFTLKPEFVRSIADLPFERLELEGQRVATLPDGVIFTFSEVK
jgi:hypothetical protein